MVMTTPESAAGSAIAMDGKGKLAARSVAACEEEASASLEAVLVGGGVVVEAAAAVVAVAAVAAAVVVVVVVSGAACADAVRGVFLMEAIVVAPLIYGCLSSGG